MTIAVKPRKGIAALLIVFMLALALGIPAMAAEGDLVYDNYDRADLKDFAGSGSNAAWADGNAGKSVSLDGNALKLEFGSAGWFGTGGGIDASPYKYLIIRAKGAAGGEGAAFNLNYAVGPDVKNTDKSFSDLVGPSGDKIPAITTEYQDLVIDLAGNGIDKGIQGFHFNFHDGASGTLWIDSISFSNTDSSAAAAPSDDNVATSEEPAAEPNPKTGDTMNVSLYIALAAISGAAFILSLRAKKATR